MKFTDGNWMMRKGVRGFYPAQAYEVETDADALTIYAPTKTIRHRGDTLDGPLLTIRFTSPLPDVICVLLSHFSGVQDHGPHFSLFPSQDHAVAVHEDEDAATLTSGRLTARIPRKGGWGVEFVGRGRNHHPKRAARHGLCRRRERRAVRP